MENLKVLSKPIFYKDEYYYIQMAEKRVWYQTLEGKVLEIPKRTTDGEISGYIDFIVDGKNLTEAMSNMVEKYLKDADIISELK